MFAEEDEAKREEDQQKKLDLSAMYQKCITDKV